MRVERLSLSDGSSGAARRAAAGVRALAPSVDSVSQDVREIIAGVRERGDEAVTELTERLDMGGRTAPPVRVAPEELDAAAAGLRPDVRAGLEIAMANVAAVAGASLGDDAELVLPQGQRILVREMPVRRAAVYVPGGRAPYPSTVVMGAVTAQVAGVQEIVVVTPPPVSPVILAACSLCGISEVLCVGGAQAVAALAYGTASIEAADVIVGPGNLWVQEAKLQCSAQVGIEGFAGPSDLLVLMAPGADARLVALDLLAQGEHGPASPVVVAGAHADLLEAVLAQIDQLAPQRPTSDPAALAVVQCPDLASALAFANAFAPEHLQLCGAAAEALAPEVRTAGTVLVGNSGATAFGDYVVGSNHVLPTGGAARFASGLSVRHFRRRMTEVHVGDAAAVLARAGAPIARAEGFAVHAESMEARSRHNG